MAIAVSTPDLSAAFGLPATAARFVVLLLILGFPVALVLAWAYEVRPEDPVEPEGVPRTGSAGATSPSSEPQTAIARATAESLAGLGPPRDDPRPSLAVLPFASFSEDAEADYFGLGVMDDVLTRLTHVRGIRLVSRTSVMRYRASEKSAREIARELGVRNVLEGSIRRAEGRVRVVAQLIDGVSDEHLWADTYDRELKDVFQVQTEVAESIAAALKAELTEAERSGMRGTPTGSLAAWELYLRAVKTLQTMQPSDLSEAEEHLREAVRLDPGFAQAWGLWALVLALAGLLGNRRPLELAPRMRDVAARALALDPRCVHGHSAMGVLKVFHDWEPREAEAEFDRALALNPDDSFALDWKATFLVLTGRWPEALTTMRRAMASDPLSLIGHTVLGEVLTYSGRLDEAVRALSAAIEMWPGAPQLYQWLGIAHLSAGRPHEALASFEAFAELSGHLGKSEAFRGAGLAQVGRREEARAVLAELQARSRVEYVDPYSFFMLDLALDGWEAAAPHLQEMVQVRSFLLPYLLSAPRYKALHGDPRFRAVREKVFPGVPTVGAEAVPSPVGAP
ncbi:MAG: tetratricopeptide repeat protein [Deltaproteobacteria bacterium]|nr:tetratricopeptide repeat protein [Deltaproteobacteria bacterium]